MLILIFLYGSLNMQFSYKEFCTKSHLLFEDVGYFQMTQIQCVPHNWEQEGCPKISSGALSKILRK